MMIDDKTQQALTHMTVRQSRRWRLKLQGYSLTEIARVEGVSVEAVRQSIAAGKISAKRKILSLEL